jgi:hypothetical protein
MSTLSVVKRETNSWRYPPAGMGRLYVRAGVSRRHSSRTAPRWRLEAEMIENLIVAVIVGASAVYAARTLLPRKSKKSCGGCDGCASEPAPPTKHRVIKIHAS